MLPVLRRSSWLGPTISDEIFSNFDRMVDTFFRDDFVDLVKSQGFTPSIGAYPKINAIAFDDRIEVEADVPGLKKEDVNIEVCDGVLTIKGEKRDDKEDKKGGRVVYRELKRSSFQRSFSLDDNLDINTIDAKFEDGLLRLTIKRKTPIKVAPEVKKIDIR
jgi:HSP20 family protein